MNIHSIVLTCWSVGIALVLLATWWSLTRVRFDQADFSIDFLAQQARRQPKAATYGLCFAALTVVIALALQFIDIPTAVKPSLAPFVLIVLIASQIAQIYLRRMRALEAIIRLSLPEVYSSIRKGKG